ncbi:MAG: hypothetical protein KKB81_08345 [Candidatus Margulisbacteria bacterium]|nr:hypothetical protein [Candidatus Margulisiibacteriota bacterium]MBU1022623.1 hypothetical protein [Candidatus Margulisiibacteriota bacterium]MBU1729440.1 hypothetical protein [Candidatus Margulisiibacteriota bacterium]MBU1955459.1 hypothetical protein [Candidatus Margulisiibacteriota bacterium]
MDGALAGTSGTELIYVLRTREIGFRGWIAANSSAYNDALLRVGADFALPHKFRFQPQDFLEVTRINGNVPGLLIKT